MNRNAFLSAVKLCFAVLLMNVSYATAWTVSGEEFFYDGSGSNDGIGTKSWNSKEIIDGQGMIGVGVNGVADPFAPGTCPQVKNCKTDDCFENWLPDADSTRQTGLYLSTYYTPKCPDSNWKGFSYFGAVPDAGFAMRSWSGMKPYDSSPSFFHPKLSMPNKGISGMYGAIRPPWHMQPWSAECVGSDCGDKVRVAVVVDHEVASASAPAGTQLQQNTRIVFLQNACDRSSMPCQFEFNSRALCKGVYCGFIKIEGADAAQGGIPYVAGFVGQPGETATAPNTGKPIWTSWGSPTQTDTFNKKRFQLEISWNQLRNILESMDLQRGGNGSRESIASTFGENWDVKSNWTMIDAGFGQEIYNPARNNRAYVGGSVQRLWVVAVSH